MQMKIDDLLELSASRDQGAFPGEQLLGLGSWNIAPNRKQLS